jgi:hypothetical protein
MADASVATDLPSQILSRAAEDPSAVWTPGDFADIAGRAATDKTLQRLVEINTLRLHRAGKIADCGTSISGRSLGAGDPMRWEMRYSHLREPSCRKLPFEKPFESTFLKR